MQIKNLIFLIPFLSLLPNLSQPATAACVDTDVSVQLAIYPRTQPRPNQSNEVNSDIHDNCFVNTATTSGIQVSVGGGQVTQKRKRTTYMASPNNPLEGIVNTPNIKTHTEHKIVVPVPLDLIP
jgi:hypothetical protein